MEKTATNVGKVVVMLDAISWQSGGVDNFV